MIINETTLIRSDTFYINGSDSLDQPVILIEGDDLTVDFGGAVLMGSGDKQWPDEFYGLAVKVENSRNVTIKNLRVRGFKVALLAERTDSLKLLNCDFSYNYRQRLRSTREREDLSDWLSYHDNEQDEWLNYGAAVYLKNCDEATVSGLRVTGGQNGLLMTDCENGLFYNNTIHFNSGVGIGLYRSSNNRVMHNRLDWNVRGFSLGFYSRGQDSAGILCYEQSNGNIFAYNSATHSGDGFFLWAGQTTMDTGEGGCNDNIIYRNDFSHAPTNGVEVTFSRNQIVGNRLEECRYGIWGGYSYESLILGNEIRENQTGIAIEHGHQNSIVANTLEDNEVGIKLWERESQPGGWPLATKWDVSSRDYKIKDNLFLATKMPLEVSSTGETVVEDNQFFNFEKLLVAEQPNPGFLLAGNVMNQTFGWNQANSFLGKNQVVLHAKPEQPQAEQLYNNGRTKALPDGMDAMLPENHPRGRSFILVGEWGPYDFRYPSIWLRTVKKDTYSFLLLGPQGNWKVVGGEGFVRVNPKTGTFPATIVATRDEMAELLRLELEFIGDSLTTRFGHRIRRGVPIPFGFEQMEVPMKWWVRFYEYDAETDPRLHEEAFRSLRNRRAGYEEETDTLAYRWWGSPGGGIDSDRFATFAETTFNIRPGTYRFVVTSDDGIRLYLDGRLLLDHWDVHTPAIDEVEVDLSGQHNLLIEHFETGGLATLDFRIVPVSTRQQEKGMFNF